MRHNKMCLFHQSARRIQPVHDSTPPPNHRLRFSPGIWDSRRRPPPKQKRGRRCSPTEPLYRLSEYLPKSKKKKIADGREGGREGVQGI